MKGNRVACLCSSMLKGTITKGILIETLFLVSGVDPKVDVSFSDDIYKSNLGMFRTNHFFSNKVNSAMVSVSALQ